MLECLKGEPKLNRPSSGSARTYVSGLPGGCSLELEGLGLNEKIDGQPPKSLRPSCAIADAGPD